MDATEKLVRALSKPDTILFIGAGISRSAGLPGWVELLESFCDYCEGCGKDVEVARTMIEANQFADAAAYITECLDTDEYAEFFRTHDQFHNAAPQPIHHKIMAFGLSCYVTTNYDTLIEDSFAEANPGLSIEVVTNDNTQQLARIRNSSAQNFVYKYHGDINHAGTIVLSSTDYSRVMHEHRIVGATLSGLFASRNVVMLGVGLSDPDLDYILGELNAIYEGNVDTIVSINPNIDDKHKAVIKKTRNIDVVSYAAIDGDHSELDELLDDLLLRVKEFKDSSDPKTAVATHPPEPLSDAIVSQRIDRVSPEDGEDRRIILSAAFWLPPHGADGLFGMTTRIKATLSRESYTRNLEWLVQENFVRISAGLIFPVDKELVEAVAVQRIDDAEILLEGMNDD